MMRSASRMVVMSVCLGAAPAMAAQGIFLVPGKTCPRDSRVVTHAEAMAAQRDVCRVLHTWDIARLAEGGSMDGPGYHCGIRDSDPRDLGHVLCERVVPSVPGVPISAVKIGVPLRKA